MLDLRPFLMEVFAVLTIIWFWFVNQQDSLTNMFAELGHM